MREYARLVMNCFDLHGHEHTIVVMDSGPVNLPPSLHPFSHALDQGVEPYLLAAVTKVPELPEMLVVVER